MIIRCGDNMKDVTVVILGSMDFDYKNLPFNVSVIGTIDNNIDEVLKKVTTKYVTFIKYGDIISDDYFRYIAFKCKSDFDCCFINYTLDCIDEGIKILTNEKELLVNKPYYGSYIWSYIFKTDLLIKMSKLVILEKYNETVDLEFKNIVSIGKVIYTHKTNEKPFLNFFCYKDVRRGISIKNAIYVGGGCNGTFNGYISWIKNMGRCFKDEFDIVIIYDAIPDKTLRDFSKYFKCIKYSSEVDYLCERLLLTYSTYYYKKNIFTVESNYMFIHGNMSDYQNPRHYDDDIYTKYFGVSKISAQKAKGYFPTNDIGYIINPFKLDEDLVKPHLKLVSAQRSTPIKRSERIEILAQIFDELDIPYTWNVFTDKNENTNKNGVIYRRRLSNPLPYVKDADFFVLLSDSEACPYSALEALALNTKVIVTPLEAFEELGVVDGENGIVIPFDYFEPENKEKLVDSVRRICELKEKEIHYVFDETLYDGYRGVFKK